CHKPSAKDAMAKGLAVHQGPDLSQVGARAHPGWLERWLESPRKLRPGTLMPEMFAAGEAGRAERYAVAAYLASLGGPVAAPAKKPDARAAADAARRGERLFTSLGCTACHGQLEGAAPKKPGKKKNDEDEAPAPVFYRPAAVYPLHGLGSKTTPAKLAAFLRDPLAVHPGGRMPNMLLQPKEAED